MVATKLGVYISKQNQDIAQMVMEIAQREEVNVSDFIWNACRLQLAHRGESLLVAELRPVLEELFEHYLGKAHPILEEQSTGNDGFFSGLLEET